jgi:hypothetical protein
MVFGPCAHLKIERVCRLFYLKYNGDVLATGSTLNELFANAAALTTLDSRIALWERRGK